MTGMFKRFQQAHQYAQAQEREMREALRELMDDVGMFTTDAVSAAVFEAHANATGGERLSDAKAKEIAERAIEYATTHHAERQRAQDEMRQWLYGKGR